MQSDSLSVNGGEYRNGRDANSVLTSIHNFDPAVGCDANTFQPCSDRALSNHKAYVDSFRSIYRINSGIPQGQAVAVGRYSEDVYFNGNPWYLTVFAAAEQLYDAIYVWKKAGSITVTQLSLPFFRDLLPSITAGTYPSTSDTYTSIINAVSTYADGFMSVAAARVASDGSMPEQFDRNTGQPLGASDLTWNYAAFLTAAARRAGVVPAGWSAESGRTLPSSCSRIEVAGSYASATAPSFPPGGAQTPNPSAGPAPSPFPTACADAGEVYVTFNARATTQWGQTIKLVGNVPELGGWNTNNAVGLSASGYAANDPLWSITVPLRAGTAVQYKYVNVQSDGSVRWESDPNRSFTVPSAGAVGACATAVRDDSWR
jgi:glucoamylase